MNYKAPQIHLCRAVLNLATCEAHAHQIVTHIEHYMNIESISYRSIVTYDDHTLNFALIATLHLRFFESSSLALQGINT